MDDVAFHKADGGGPRTPAAGESGGRAGRMTAPSAGVKVRMYRCGHGDCFLLAFPGAQRPVYVLIDCGCMPGSDGAAYGLRTIDAVVGDIKAATGRRIDLVVLTNAHQDHLNGIGRDDAPFDDVRIGAAWLPWTEDPDDDLARELRRRHGNQLAGLAAARDRLAAAAGDAATARLDSLLSLELDADTALAAVAARPEAAAGRRAITLVRNRAGQANTTYIRPHREILRIPGIDGVRVFGLGPPYDPDLLADHDPQGPESLSGHAVRASASFMGAAVAGRPGAAPALQPFAPRFAVPWRKAFSDPRCGFFFAEHYGAGRERALADLGAESADDAGWRRIDSDWLRTAGQLALDLNQGINDSSLVLAFELERSGKVLLFVSDAQRRSWMSWSRGSWQADGREITARDLLARTVLYKAGHHGGHDATLNGRADSDYPNLSWMGQGRYAREFTAMIPAVRQWASAQRPPWNHPLPAIERALRAKCSGRLLQTDTTAFERQGTGSGADWQDFRRRIHVDPGGLYFEYEVRDD